MFSSYGTLRYVGAKLIVEADQGVSDFYRALIPKWYVIQPQKYRAHISVVRKEVPLHMEFWGRHEGQEIEFWYDSEIKHGGLYWWLDCYSARLEEIRLELGLTLSSRFEPPLAPFRKRFHLTLANSKKKE